jgi:hypothetical protein
MRTQNAATHLPTAAEEAFQHSLSDVGCQVAHVQVAGVMARLLTAPASTEGQDSTAQHGMQGHRFLLVRWSAR